MSWQACSGCHIPQPGARRVMTGDTAGSHWVVNDVASSVAEGSPSAGQSMGMVMFLGGCGSGGSGVKLLSLT